MSGSKGKCQTGLVREEGELDAADDAGSTTDATAAGGGAEEDSLSSSNRAKKRRAVTGLGGSNEASAPSQPETAAVVPPVGGFGLEESKGGGEQETLREQLEQLVSNKLRTLGGDLDHAGLVALEALAKLPAVKDLTGTAGASAGTGAGAGDGRAKKTLPRGLEKIKKFSGKNPAELTDTLNQFYSLVMAALVPNTSPASVEKALNRDVVFVLEGSALKFYNSLKAGKVEWESLPPPPAAGGGAPHLSEAAGARAAASGKQQQEEEAGLGERRFRPPSTWAELCEAFHDHFLPAAGIARTSEKLLSSSQAPGESVLSLAQRQLGLATHLNRLIEANGGQIDFMEAISIRLFERGLRADLRRIHETEPPCLSFQQSVDRAERNAMKLAKMGDSSGKGEENTGPPAPTGQTSVVATEGGAGAGGASAGGAGSGAGAGAVAAGSGAATGGAISREPKHNASTRRGQNVVQPCAISANVLPEQPKYAADNRVGNSGDTSQGSVDAFPDDGPPSVSLGEPSGSGEEGRAFGKRRRAKRGQKRPRDSQDNRHFSQNQFQGLPPVDQGDPDATPPCRNPECRSINRNFHSSNDCWYGKKGNGSRRKNRPPPGFRHRGPPSYDNNGFNQQFG